MDAFGRELNDRLPLACATLELFDFAFDDEDLTAEAFETVDSVLALVQKKLS